MKTFKALDHSINWSQELEIISNNSQPYGFDVTITYTTESIAKWNKLGLDLSEPEIRHNCHEVHHNFRKGMSAFESDIHSTGGCLEHYELQSIVVNVATKLHDNY